MTGIWGNQRQQLFKLALIQTAWRAPADIDGFKIRTDLSVKDFLFQCIQPLIRPGLIINRMGEIAVMADAFAERSTAD